MRRKGFTLIELCVVIAVIAILAAILFPTMYGAYKKARQITCLSSEHQIALSIGMYVGDYNGIFPISQYFPASGANLKMRDGTVLHKGCYWWSDAISSYLGNRGLLYCPDDFRADCRQSYVIIAPPFYYENYPQGFAESRVARPSEGLMLVETGTGCPYLGDWHASCYWSGVETLASQKAFIPERHSGGQNMTFCDGHAKWVKVEWTKERSTGEDLWRVAFGLKPYYPY